MKSDLATVGTRHKRFIHVCICNKLGVMHRMCLKSGNENMRMDLGVIMKPTNSEATEIICF